MLRITLPTLGAYEISRTIDSQASWERVLYRKKDIEDFIASLKQN